MQLTMVYTAVTILTFINVWEANKSNKTAFITQNNDDSEKNAIYLTGFRRH